MDTITELNETLARLDWDDDSPGKAFRLLAQIVKAQQRRIERLEAGLDKTPSVNKVDCRDADFSKSSGAVITGTSINLG